MAVPHPPPPTARRPTAAGLRGPEHADDHRYGQALHRHRMVTVARRTMVGISLDPSLAAHKTVEQLQSSWPATTTTATGASSSIASFRALSSKVATLRHRYRWPRLLSSPTSCRRPVGTQVGSAGRWPANGQSNTNGSQFFVISGPDGVRLLAAVRHSSAPWSAGSDVVAHRLTPWARVQGRRKSPRRSRSPSNRSESSASPNSERGLTEYPP